MRTFPCISLTLAAQRFARLDTHQFGDRGGYKRQAGTCPDTDFQHTSVARASTSPRCCRMPVGNAEHPGEYPPFINPSTVLPATERQATDTLGQNTHAAGRDFLVLRVRGFHTDHVPISLVIKKSTMAAAFSGPRVPNHHRVLS